MLACLGRFDRPLGVQVVGQGIVDNIHFRVGQQGFVTAVRARDAVLGGVGLGAFLAARSDSEQGVALRFCQRLEERGIDSRRIIIGEPATIQEFRHKVITVLNRYKDIPKKDRPPMFMVLDSMGNLSSTKEVEDTESGVETRDMTKSQLLRATWRVIRLKLAKVDVAMIVTNHTYMGIGLYASKEMCLAEGSEIKTPSGLMENQKLKIFSGTMTGLK